MDIYISNDHRKETKHEKDKNKEQNEIFIYLLLA